MHLEKNGQNRVRQILKLKFGVFAGIGFVVIFAGYQFLKLNWVTPFVNRWVVVSSVAFLSVLWLLGKNLDQNHRPGQHLLLSSLGIGNILSLVRGIIMTLFMGFVFSPWPSGWLAWFPGILFTLATIPDFLDGALARLTDQVTKLGESLDMNIDSLGVLGVSVIAVTYGQVPCYQIDPKENNGKQ